MTPITFRTVSSASTTRIFMVPLAGVLLSLPHRLSHILSYRESRLGQRPGVTTPDDYSHLVQARILLQSSGGITKVSAEHLQSYGQLQVFRHRCGLDAAVDRSFPGKSSRRVAPGLSR